MKNTLYILLALIVVWACNKEDYCKKMVHTAYWNIIYVDPNEQSLYYQDTVLVFQPWYKLLSYYGNCHKCCPDPVCLETKALKVFNKTSNEIELTVELAGRGDYKFNIPKLDTMFLTPLPDYCKDMTWGKVKDVKYK
ncbi:MAG TPA: hypothetical protein PKN42_12135 [Saprospiraceae bacterium]|jgi:hypothetical protein|nr:hypothetical protein [Saprospiraceae bacterium]HNM59394.1 hypothetical protein [Saprospiraceae bacterium]